MTSSVNHRRKQYDRAYYARNRDRIRGQQRAYYARNGERIRQHRRARYASLSGGEYQQLIFRNYINRIKRSIAHKSMVLATLGGGQ
jgi:hypothetical protein